MLNEKNKESICVQAKASLELGNHYDPKWWVEEVIGSPIGGPLDGELREVPSACIRTPAQRGRGPATFTITNLTLVPPEYVDYDIANGIARHESLSEEEVARMVKALMLTVGVSTWDMTKGAG